MHLVTSEFVYGLTAIFHGATIFTPFVVKPKQPLCSPGVFISSQRLWGWEVVELVVNRKVVRLKLLMELLADFAARLEVEEMCY